MININTAEAEARHCKSRRAVKHKRHGLAGFRLRSGGFTKTRKEARQASETDRALPTRIGQNGFNTMRITMTIKAIVGTSLIILYLTAKNNLPTVRGWCA
jgi:hypothetical protein